MDIKIMLGYKYTTHHHRMEWIVTAVGAMETKRNAPDGQTLAAGGCREGALSE